MRQIVLDTETTGIGPGHRLIEIACIELDNRVLTGNHFQVYLNPERNIDDGAFRVHGIKLSFLQDKPFFKDIVSDFITFITGAELIIHNAPFDLGFLNAELKQAKHSLQISNICSILDTLVLAKQKHPGQRNNLDALCKRYDIDNSKRTYHGALLDAEILAQVYLAMTGGQINLFANLESEETSIATSIHTDTIKVNRSPIIWANADELEEHNKFMLFLEKQKSV